MRKLILSLTALLVLSGAFAVVVHRHHHRYWAPHHDKAVIISIVIDADRRFAALI